MKTASDPIYVQEFLFKQSNRSQVFDLKTPTYIPVACNLLVADKKRGLLYIGHEDKITVLKPAEENKAEWKIELQLPGVISKIAINCDYNYIAIAVAVKPTILIYDVHSLVRNSLNLLLEIASSNKPDSYVTDIRWNPTVPMMFCTVTSDCTIGSFQLRTDENSASKISILSKMSNEPQALCAAWSPKGKQVAVGCKNGDIVQLKPDTLKIARIIAGPTQYIGEVISILWISNYQFCAVYLNKERHTNVLIVDAPKGETNAIFTCYEDITYGFPDAEGEESIIRYYLEYVPEWGLIIAGSSTSSEIAVLGTTDGGANWNQWQFVDSGRAQLPLIRTTEIYPMGLAVDKSPINKLPWGTDSTLPHPVPILHILGTSGQLCSFHMVNLTPNCPVINIQPTEIIKAPTLSQPSTSSADISFAMNAAVTSTPRPKQLEIVSERSRPAPMTNIFGDSLKAAGFFQQSVEQPVIQPKLHEEKAMPLTITKPVMSREIPASEPIKTETKLGVVDKETSLPQIVEEKASIDDSIRMRAYLQEQALFEKELRNRLEPQVWECGTDEERKRLGETSVVIEQFLKDLKDTTNSLSSDIAYLKALLLQSFAWVEETKSKNAATADITGRNCSDNSKIAELQRCYYYTQTQLNQVSKILDLEWSEHKARERSRMKIPSLEYVYQNLLIHNKIITKEKEKLEQISRQWKSLNRSLLRATGDTSSLNRSMANLHMNSHEKSSSIRKTDVINARCKAIAARTLSFTNEKQIKLKTLLTESSPRIIKPVNPSPIQDRLKATLSSLASLNPPVTEANTKTESSIVKQSTIAKQQTVVEKQIKAQSPLASLNSIVARIGSSDMSNSIQNKTQQKLLPATVSFSPAMSVKQTDKKAILPIASILSQAKAKQDLNVNFPSSITFGTPTLKSQDIFSKSPLTDTTVKNIKESTTNNSISKAPESALSSTGMLKDALSTECALTETARIGIVRNLPPLSAAPAVKTDTVVAPTLSFATPNAVSSAMKNLSSGIALDTTTLSLAYSKSITNVEPFVTAVQAPMQTPIDLSGLSLTLQPTNHSNNNGKINTVTTSMSFATLAPATTTQVPAMTGVTMGGLTISLVDPNITQRKSKDMPSITSSVTIEKIATSEAKTINFGSITTNVPSASLSATPIFGGQPIIKNPTTIPEATITTLPATTTFGAVGFPSITPTFGTSTPSSTASVFSGFTNTSAGITVTSSSVTSISSSIPSPFQSSLSKPTFGETTTSIPATNYGISSSNISAGTISFGISTIMTTTTMTTMATGAPTATVSITPAFSKDGPIASPVSNAQFPSVQISGSSVANNVFTKSVINPASTLFSGTSSVFSSGPAATSSNISMFGGNSMNSIFKSASVSPPSENIFGGNATGFNTSASSGPIFDTDTPKANIFGGTGSTSPSTSPFGSTTSNASPMIGTSAASTNVFRSTMLNASPIQQSVLGGNQSAFGQGSNFGTKPVFGSSPVFGASKPFGSSFGSAPTFESPGIGFGNPSVMQGGSTMENMSKLFGDVAGSSTFESLASQSGSLGFDSLAQKSPESEKPTFTAGSSFSSWR